MKLEHEFTVVAPIEDTWEALLDVERVATCLPGATVQPGAEEGSYDGQMKLKLGPMSVAYKGTLRMAEVDAAARRAVMQIQARELKGQGGATARMESRLESGDDGRTRVLVGTDLDVSGRAAQLGRGMLDGVADRLLGDFARRLERQLTAGQPDDGPDAPGGAPQPAPDAAHAPDAAAAAPSAGPTAASDEDALDLGGLALGAMRGRERVVLVGAGTLAALALLVRSRRRSPVALTVSYRSGRRGRRVQVRLRG